MAPSAALRAILGRSCGAPGVECECECECENWSGEARALGCLSIYSGRCCDGERGPVDLRLNDRIARVTGGASA